jgi:hypothetical protein
LVIQRRGLGRRRPCADAVGRGLEHRRG